MNDVDAVGVLELQQRRHHAQTTVDERVPNDLPILPLDQGIGDIGLPVGIQGRRTKIVSQVPENTTFTSFCPI